MAALYYTAVELENLMRTNRQVDREQTENSITEATRIPVDCRGERANILEYYDTRYYTMDCVPWTLCQLSRIPGNRQE